MQINDLRSQKIEVRNQSMLHVTVYTRVMINIPAIPRKL